MKLPTSAVAPVIAVTLLVAGCATANKPVPGPSSNSPAASIAASGSPDAGAISCRLPVAGANAGNGTPLGFIELPSGAFQADSTTGIVYDSAARVPKTTQTPVLYGDSGATYDRAAGRWVPVAPAQVLGDGSAYVYTREASATQAVNEIHLVNVATATDRIIYNQGAYDAIAYRPEGIYLVHHLNGTDAANGLWLLDPVSGSIKGYPAGAQGTWIAIAAGGAWSYSVDGNRFGSSGFARLDLGTGTVATWYTATSSVQPPQSGSRVVRVIGFDRGEHPIVEIYTLGGNTPEVWLLTSPSQATRVRGLTLGDYTPPPGVTDIHGAWVVGLDGVYLYGGNGSQRMAAAPPGWMPDYSVAGGCS